MPAEPSARPGSSSSGLLEGASDAIVVVGATGRVSMANAQALDMFGWQGHDLVGESLTALVPDAVDRARVRQQVAVAIASVPTDGVPRLSVTARRRDGSIFPVRITFSVLRTEAGTLVSVMFRDASLAHRDEQLFRGLLEAAPDAIVIVDADGMIVLVNAQVEALFGYDRSELVGQRVEILVPERLAGAHEDFRSGYGRDPRTRPMGLAGALHARRKDGSEFPVEISLAPLDTDDGMLVSAAVRDITERLALAEAMNRAKDEVFATVSHELRTPLTSVIGYGELLGELEALSVRGHQFLDVMMRSARRELRLVDDLLTLVQIEDSGLAISFETLDLREVVREAVAASHPKAERAGLHLGMLIPGAPVSVQGDADRLGQTVDNLLSNAVKFSPEGGAIRVELRAVGSTAHIEVIDSGRGIDPSDHARVFERLYRCPDVVADQIPGAGLGLTIALAIVEAHGGRIGVVGSGESGTTVRIELPLSP